MNELCEVPGCHGERVCFHYCSIHHNEICVKETTTEYERLEVQYNEMKHKQMVNSKEYKELQQKYDALEAAARIVVENARPFIEDMVGIASAARPTLGDIDALAALLKQAEEQERTG